VSEDETLHMERTVHLPESLMTLMHIRSTEKKNQTRRALSWAHNCERGIRHYG